MLTNKFTSYLMVAGMVLAISPLRAQRVSQSQIPLSPPVTVNFQQLSDYELTHPVKHKHRFIEQGEDRERNFHFTPKPVPTDALNFNIPPQTSHGNQIQSVSPAPTTSFNGVMDNGTLIPPDIRGAAGSNYIMQTTNQEFKIYTKTGTLNSTVSITSFFSGSGGSGFFDPHIVYDNTNSRFIICIDGNLSNGHGGVFMAISKTNDPTGAWWVYGFDGIGNTTDFLDYPLLGYNTNWVVVSANDFLGGSNPVGKIYVMNRASLYAGTLGTVSTFTDNNAFAIAPAETKDASQTIEYLVQDWNGNSSGSGFMQISTITGSASAPVYTAGATIGVTQPWSETSVGAKQSGSTHTLEDGDTRTGNSVYINGSLWFCHTAFLPATSPTHSAVDWWQINPAAPSVQQFGRLENTTGPVFYFYPSINVNSNGDALMGFCQSSSSSFVSSAYVFHASTDAANTMETSYLYKSGVASYYKTFGGGRNRWGDYTGTAVDPTDGSFWNFSEWANTSNKWATVIAHIPATAGVACNAPGGMSTTAITTTTATFNWTAATGAVSYNVQYRVIGAGSWSTGTSATTSYNASGLTAGTNYEWQVQTVCSAGYSAFTASTNFTTTSLPCNPATGMATGSITSSSATLSWAAVTGAVSYNIQYRIVGAGTWTSTTSTTASKAISGLTASSNYEWQVQTVCSGGSSAFTASTNFTTLAPAACGVAGSLTSSAITSSGATLSWATVTGAVSYNIQYRIVGAGTWTSTTSTTASKTISGLTASSNYEWQVQTVCSGSSSAFTASATFTTLVATITYCTSKGNNTTYEYINKVALGTINNTSGDNGGYHDYTALSTNIAGGTANTITLTPGFHSSSYKEYWNVWIDYSHNGVFTDAGEKVATGNSTGALSISFTVPTTAFNGTTRMRVQMEYNAAPTTSCLTYTYGEVEDYTVIVTGNAQGPQFAPGDVSNSGIGEMTEISSVVTLYPNPAQDKLTVEFTSNMNGKVQVNVFNLFGQKVINMETPASQGLNILNLNTSELAKGVYVFELLNADETERQKFMITR